MITLIAAMDHARAIGVGGRLPWHLPDDLKRFKALTLGKTVLMGRKTAQSLGRALPGRVNLVLSRNAMPPYEGMRVIATLEDAVERTAPGDLVVIGGGEVYALALPCAGILHLTLVDAQVSHADTWFPQFDPKQWREVARAVHGADPRHAYAFEFVDYERVW